VVQPGADGNFLWEYSSNTADKVIGINSIGEVVNTTTAAYKHRPNIRFPYTVAAPCSGAVGGTATTVTNGACAGAAVALNVTGATTGQNVTYQWESSPINSNYQPLSTTSLSPMYMAYPMTSTWYRCKVVCNGGTPAYSTPVQVTISGAMSGTYTINANAPASATNFISFAAATAALNCSGVSGPVTINVVPGSGPYTELVVFGDVPDASASNRIRVNGNGNTIQYSTVTANKQGLQLNGAKYLTLDSLTIKTLGTSVAYGANIYGGAMNDSIIRCTFDISSSNNAIATNTVGLTFSGNGLGANTATTTEYYWFYDWKISVGCGSERVPVIATIEPMPYVNLGVDQTICEGASLVLDASNPGALYLWDNASTSQTRTINAIGQYAVTVTLGNCSASDTIEITAAPLPAGDFTFTSGADGVVVFSATMNNAVNSYWNFGDGNTGSGSAVSHQYDANGIYQVTLTIKNECDDSIVISKSVTVQNKTDIGEVFEDGAISVYPNPAATAINLVNEGTNVVTGFTLYDALGRIVGNYNWTAGQKAQNVAISHLSRGMYQLIIHTAKGNVVRKIAVQ
jgi:hypothetical protein